MTFSPKKIESSVIHDSATTVFMLCFTSSHPRDMRKLLSISSGRQVQRRPNIEHTSLDSLREIDIELMRRLSPRVNVIPVIGRADSLTPQELRDFKRRIMEDIEHYNIPIYNFPYDPEEDDEDTVEENSELRVSIFF